MFALEGRGAAEGSAHKVALCSTGVSETVRCEVKASSDQRFTEVLATEGVELIFEGGVQRWNAKPVNQGAEFLCKGG